MQNAPSVMIGALIALVGTVLVQLWLVPLVDARKRREQRWEADLRALGEALLFRDAEATDSFRRALLIRATIASAAIQEDDPERKRSLRLESDASGQDEWSAYRRVRAQMDWLADEVKAIAPNSPALAELAYRLALHRNAHRKMTFMWASVHRHPDPDAVRGTYWDVVFATEEVVKELRTLAARRMPRRPSWISSRRNAHVRGVSLDDESVGLPLNEQQPAPWTADRV
jgi:hypothetical protein